MAKVIIFGIRDTAQLAHFYLTHDSGHKVVAFSVSRDYMPTAATFRNLPVLQFEEIEHTYNPSEVRFFAPMTARKMNTLREAVYNKIKAKGYRCISYISSRATVYPGADIGENCFILENNTIQPFTPIGNNVVMWSGNHIGHHGIIKDHVFFTSHVVLSGHCTVEPHCFFGVNSTIRNHIHLSQGSLIGMGACITRNTEAWGVYKGNPAKKCEVSSNNLDL